MKTVLITGAAGDIGSRMRKLLKGVYPQLRWSDIRKPADLAPDETFIAADLADYAQVEKIVERRRMASCISAAIRSKAPWETILSANIIGCRNCSRRPIVPASRAWCLPRPITRRILSAERSASASTLRSGPTAATASARRLARRSARSIADKHGLRVTCLRIGNVADAPVDKRRLSIWLKPEDLVQLIRIGLEHPRHPLRDLLRCLR